MLTKISKAFLSLLILSSPVMATVELSDPPNIDVTLVSEQDAAVPGTTFKIGAHIQIEDGWHIYWKSSGDSGFPTKFTIEPSKDVKSFPTQWPRPEVFREEGDIVTIGYKDETLLVKDISISEKAKKGPLVLTGSVKWLACKTVCIPGEVTIQRDLTIASKADYSEDEGPLINEWAQKIPSLPEEKTILENYRQLAPAPKGELDFIGSKAARQSIFIYLIFALLGGLLLNIMPCVLPVLSIKALRLINHGKATKKMMRQEAWAYTAGILASFLFLAAFVIGVKAGGEEIGWGFQFQEPRFLIFLAALVFGFGLSLFGVYEFSLVMPSRIEKLTRRAGWVGPFWEGVFITALATPCTAPLLGPALGFSFAQPPAIIILFFMLIGIGLAAPYLLLADFPGWTKHIPKPGVWMITLKQIMGFPLVATAIWLLWVLGRQMGQTAVIGALTFLFVIGMALWILGKWGTPASTAGTRWTARIAAASIIVLTYIYFVEPKIQMLPLDPVSESETINMNDAIHWEDFSLTDLKESLDAGETVFVDFTADWCLTCQVNKRGVLRSRNVVDAFRKYNITAYRADWTHRNDEITRILKQMGRSGVPVYVVFKDGDGKNPHLLPELLTEKIILNAIVPNP